MTGRAMAIRARADTDPRYGCAPADRPMADHLRLGVLNLDKPRGPTSHQVVAWIKRALEVEKAGHGGTLDPNVSGVLPVALLDATRTLHTLLEGTKEYVSVLELQDAVDPARARDVLLGFQGPIYQVPPKKSAVKRELRVRTIHSIEILEQTERHVLFRLDCDPGTYVRKLCHDAGLLLGVGGHMRDLRRTRSGPFLEGDAVTLHDAHDAYVFWRDDGEEGPLRRVVRPMEDLLAPLRRIVVRDTAVDALCHGADLAVPGIVEVERGTAPGDPVAVLTLKGEGVAVGRALLGDQDLVTQDTGLAVSLDRVLMDPGTYPQGWSSSKA